jgi:hypothetical protein
MKSMVSARPCLRAISRRSGTVSMAVTRPAPSIQALWMVNCPTGPHPHTATVSPGSMSAFTAAIQPVGKMSERKSTCSSGRSESMRSGPTSA